MNNKGKIACYLGMGFGAFCLLDALMYAFAGFGMWATPPACADGRDFCNHGREMVLFISHLLGFIVGCICLGIWCTDD